MSKCRRVFLVSCASVLLLAAVLVAPAGAQPFPGCEVGCDDGNPCTDDFCVQGLFCINIPDESCNRQYLCYDTTLPKGVKKPKPIPGVHVVDVFEDLTFSITDQREICNPASDVEFSESLSPSLSPTHLNRYQLKADKKAKRSMPKGVVVENQFGTLSLDAVIGDKLLVPTAKSLIGPPPPLAYPPDVDHYKCYDVVVHKGTPKFPTGVQVTLLDQFTNAPKTWNVVGPAHLCPVAQKNGEPVNDPCGALVCYDVADPVKKAKFKAIKGVYTLDQFGPLKFDVIDKDEVCVPSKIKDGEGTACLEVSTTTTTTVTTTTTPSTTVTTTTVTTSTTVTTTTTSTTSTTVAPSCAGASCSSGAECTSSFCDDSSSPGVCAPVCADPMTTCVCGGDCTSGFCNDSGGSPGFCAPVCAGPSTQCVCGGDCTSGFCDDSGGSPGFCAPVCAGPSTQCLCGGDCTSGFCNGGVCAPVAAGGQCVCGGDCTSQNCQGGVCQPNCAGGACVYGGDCTSGFCDGDICQPVFPGGDCVCGGDCVDGFCDGGTCVGLNF